MLKRSIAAAGITIIDASRTLARVEFALLPLAPIRCDRLQGRLPFLAAFPQVEEVVEEPLVHGGADSAAARLRAYIRRIFSREPQVAIEHHLRRPLVSRNSQPQSRPGQRCSCASRAGSASSATASA